MRFTNGIIFVIWLVISGLPSASYAAEINQQRARQNYILNCQGCHLADGSGAPGVVPNMNGFLGNFLRVQGGRDFIIRVPGAANSSLNDEHLAEVMNWILYSFSNNELPEDFRPYTADEINRLRKNSLTNVHYARKNLIREMEKRPGIKMENEHAGTQQ